MAGQGIERREVMRLLALASAASAFPGFRRWAFACDHGVPPNGSPKKAGDPYRPLFFSSREYALVEHLAHLIIPSDGTPGAREAGASEFIDFMVANTPVVQTQFREGLKWMDAQARKLFGRAFLNLGLDQQNKLLEPLAYKNRYRPGEEDGRKFFALIRTYTVMGFYTSRIGMEALEIPSLQTVWKEMPGCPHPDDPEHRNLAPTGLAEGAE